MSAELRRQELDAQIKVINQEYQRALHEEEVGASAEGGAHGR